MLTKACKNCEDNWKEKNIWFVYGDCYCAEPVIYQRVKDTLTYSIQKLNVELSKTNEIAKIKKVDPLGISDLRVRGMRSIQHPNRVFNYVIDKTTAIFIRAIMLQSKFYFFDEQLRAELTKKATIEHIKIQNPNNPANLLDAILIEYKLNI